MNIPTTLSLGSLNIYTHGCYILHIQRLPCLFPRSLHVSAPVQSSFIPNCKYNDHQYDLSSLMCSVLHDTVALMQENGGSLIFWVHFPSHSQPVRKRMDMRPAQGQKQLQGFSTIRSCCDHMATKASHARSSQLVNPPVVLVNTNSSTDRMRIADRHVFAFAYPTQRFSATFTSSCIAKVSS